MLDRSRGRVLMVPAVADLSRTQAQAEPVLAVAVSRVAAIPARIPVEIQAAMTVMMMSLTTRPMGSCARNCTGALFFVGEAVDARYLSPGRGDLSLWQEFFPS